MSEGDERETRVYLRCEACGTIVRPAPDGSLPPGWIDLGRVEGYNAPLAVCSEPCRAQIEARPRGGHS